MYNLKSNLVLIFLQHYICWSDIPVPRISVTFSLDELKEIEKDCAVYVGRMERIARYSNITKEEKVNIFNRIISEWSIPRQDFCLSDNILNIIF